MTTNQPTLQQLFPSFKQIKSESGTRKIMNQFLTKENIIKLTESYQHQLNHDPSFHQFFDHWFINQFALYLHSQQLIILNSPQSKQHFWKRTESILNKQLKCSLFSLYQDMAQKLALLDQEDQQPKVIASL